MLLLLYPKKTRGTEIPNHKNSTINNNNNNNNKLTIPIQKNIEKVKLYPKGNFDTKVSCYCKSHQYSEHLYIKIIIIITIIIIFK